MVLIGEVEPAVFDSPDELADVDVISGGGDGLGMFAASRWPKLARLVRSRRARIIAVPVLAGAVAGAALLVTDSHPANGSGPPIQQITIPNTAVQTGGVAGPDGLVWVTGCHRGRGCPRG